MADNILGVSSSLKTKDGLNTNALPARVAADLTAALCASTLVAPVITVIDQSIIKRTHQPKPIREHLLTATREALRKPGRFFTSGPYLLITSLYLATYLTANLTDTYSSTVRNGPADKVYSGTTKFVATSATNMAMCLYKDAQFAKMFGASAANSSSSSSSSTLSGKTATKLPLRAYSTVAVSALREAVPSASSAATNAVKKAVTAPKVPRISLTLFAIRDSMTVFASFNVPPLLGPLIGSNSAAQFLAPALVQFASTPLHLLGLDLYNRPKGCSQTGCNGGIMQACRWECVRRDWLSAAFARIGRIVPAFGVGGVVNASVRKSLMGGIESKSL